MRNFIFCLLATFSLGLAISSCGNKAKSSPDTETTEVVDKTGIEYTSAYVCPMHCKGSGSDQAGKCPVCEMDYVVNEDYQSATEEDNHDGHDHDDHEGHNH